MLPDVIISGAGPGGVATAVALVRHAGLSPDRVLVLERSRFPRSKPCGGGLTGHARAAMAALGLELRIPSVPCRQGRVVFGKLERTVPLADPVHVVRREELDADLAAQARALGIPIVEEEGLSSFAVSAGDRRGSRGRRGADGHVDVVTTRGRRLRARVLVGADGAGSSVRRHLLAGYRRSRESSFHPRRSAGGPDLVGPPGLDTRRRQPIRLSRLELAVSCDPGDAVIYDFTPFVDGLKGYVWLFPVPGGRLNVGIMHYPASALGGRGLNAILSSTLSRHGLELARPAIGWPAWPYDPRAPIAGRHLLCVGDAAGIDALTGEGIAVALEHGLIAAKAVAIALRREDFRFQGYRHQVRRAVVGRELALDGAMARLLYGSADFRTWLSLVMLDDEMVELYAARVCGSQVLADRKGTLLVALIRHFMNRRRRVRSLEAALGGTSVRSMPV